MSRASRFSEAGREVDPGFAHALQEGARRGRHRPRAGHKDRQLCRQVQRVLSLALEGELGDVCVADVSPLAGCARLLVQVAIADVARTPEVLALLRARSGMLRAQVAQAISRKRAPELTFVPAVVETCHDAD